MMSGCKLLDRVELAHVASLPNLLSLPSCHGMFGGKQARKEYTRRISPPDNACVGISIGDVKMPVTVFDLRRVRNEDFAFKTSPRHVHSPSNSTTGSKTEQVELGPQSRFLRNEPSQVIDSLSASLRRTDGTVSNMDFGPYVPSNDNAPPSVAEAA